MRRIYESNAVQRDDEQPHVPSETGRDRPRAFRSIDVGAVGRRLVPASLRHRAISVDVTTPRTEYPVGSTVPFGVTMKNAMPFRVALTTRSRLPWQWDVDGHPEGSQVEVHDAPEGEAVFEFARGERKEFRRRWSGMFRLTESEWEPADPGGYTIGAAINVGNTAGEGLRAETTVRITPE